MINVKSISLYALGFLIAINQGFNMVLGTLSEGGARGADVLMPLDLPLYVLLITQRDGTLRSRYRSYILSIKILLMGFFILSLLGELVAVEPADFRVQMVHLSRALLIAYVVMTRLNTSADLRAFIYGLLSSLAFESFVGAWQWQIGPLNIPFMPRSSGFRVAGTIAVPNAFGAWLVTLIPLCLRMALYTKLKPRMVWISVLILSLACLLATYTRGAWMSFLVMTAVFTTMDVAKKKLSGKQISWFLALVLVLAVVIPMKYGFAIKERMADTEDALKGDKKSSRMYLAQDALRIISGHQLLGVGLDNYRYHADPEILGTRIVHNVYLLVCAEQGVLVALLFIFLLLLVVVKSWRLLNSKMNFYYHVAAATIAGTLGLSIYYMVGLDYNIFEVLFQHWRLIGMLPALLVCEENARQALTQPAAGQVRKRPMARSAPPPGAEQIREVHRPSVERPYRYHSIRRKS